MFKDFYFMIAIISLFGVGCTKDEDGAAGPTNTDTGEVVGDCGQLGLPVRPFDPEQYTLFQRHEPSGDFTVPLIDGTEWTLSEQWSGCDSYIFLPHYFTIDAAGTQSWWTPGIDGLLEKSPKNAHYFFVIAGATDDPTLASNLADNISENLASLSTEDSEWWSKRLHVVAGPSNDIDGLVGQIFQGALGTYGMAIDRFQKLRTLGTMAAVEHYNPDLDWPWEYRIQEAGYQPEYYNFEAEREARLAVEDALVIEVMADEVWGGNKEATLVLPDNITDYDTLEVDIIMECPNANGYELGNCGPWDYLSYLWLWEDFDNVDDEDGRKEDPDVADESDGTESGTAGGESTTGGEETTDGDGAADDEGTTAGEGTTDADGAADDEGSTTDEGTTAGEGTTDADGAADDEGSTTDEGTTAGEGTTDGDGATEGDGGTGADGVDVGESTPDTGESTTDTGESTSDTGEAGTSDTGTDDTGRSDTGLIEEPEEEPPPPTGRWIEMVRVITTYHRESRWVVDASHALAWLQEGGSRTVRYQNSQSTNVTIRFRFSKRNKQVAARSSADLFRGGGFNTAYNDRDPVEVTIPADAEKVELVTLTTGHGMDARNCAEFCDHSHHFTVNGTEFSQVFDEPGNDSGCADTVSQGTVPNQGGTWWYGRGGWCPGLEVVPFVVDVTDQVTPGETATITYHAKLQGGSLIDGAGRIEHTSWLVFHH